MAKVLGITASVTIGGIDYGLEKCTFKIGQEKIEYRAMGGGGWITRIPGGIKEASGSFECAVDSDHLGSNYIAPFDDQLVSFSIPISGKTLSFSAVIDDVDVDKQSVGLVKVKGNYSSSGAVTFA